VAGIALVIIIILLINNGSLRNQVGEADGLQAENTRLQDELNLIRIELEGAVESLSNAQLQLQQQQEQEDLMLMELPDDEFGEESGSMAMADAVRTHTVVSGDSLSRIANTFFGDSSQANIQRIMEANNITNPNSIHVGQVLDIPN
jgi:nucleoid-associated protein YgaU